MGFRFSPYYHTDIITNQKEYNKPPNKCAKASKKPTSDQLTKKNKAFLKSLGFQLLK